MDKIKEIQEKANNCLHCGQKPKVYHQDYIGESYVGDEYCIECDCGISTHFDKDEAVLKIWNSKAPISCDDGMDNKKWVEKAKRTGTILWNKLYDDETIRTCYCGKPIDTTNPDCVEFNLCKDHAMDV